MDLGIWWNADSTANRRSYKGEKIMEIYFKEFEDEVDTLVEFLSSDTWEFHRVPNQVQRASGRII